MQGHAAYGIKLVAQSALSGMPENGQMAENGWLGKFPSF